MCPQGDTGTVPPTGAWFVCDRCSLAITLQALRAERAKEEPGRTAPEDPEAETPRRNGAG